MFRVFLYGACFSQSSESTTLHSKGQGFAVEVAVPEWRIEWKGRMEKDMENVVIAI